VIAMANPKTGQHQTPSAKPANLPPPNCYPGIRVLHADSKRVMSEAIAATENGEPGDAASTATVQIENVEPVRTAASVTPISAVQRD
jgi:hypothetical protein